MLTYQYFMAPVTITLAPVPETLTGVLIWGARLVFEFAHTFIIFGIQLASFTLMIFWVFQFLFTLFFGEPMEFSFSRRAQN